MSSDDSAFKSELAYILQEILSVDTGIAEGDLLAEDRLEEVATVFFRHLPD